MKLKDRDHPGPNIEELKALVHTMSHRVAAFLERRGLLERDAESSYLEPEWPNIYCIAEGLRPG